jgi:hypothetical protein
MEIQINVTIDLSDRTLNALQGLLAAPRQLHAAQPVELQPTPTPAPAEDAATAGTQPEAAPPAQPEAATPAQPEPPAPIHGDRAKTIMAATRDRLEGPNWESREKGSKVDTIHRALTAKFKVFASEAGFNKPSEINTDAGLNAFAAACSSLQLNDKGEVISKECPF